MTWTVEATGRRSLHCIWMGRVARWGGGGVGVGGGGGALPAAPGRGQEDSAGDGASLGGGGGEHLGRATTPVLESQAWRLERLSPGPREPQEGGEQAQVWVWGLEAGRPGRKWLIGRESGLTSARAIGTQSGRGRESQGQRGGAGDCQGHEPGGEGVGQAGVWPSQCRVSHGAGLGHRLAGTPFLTSRSMIPVKVLTSDPCCDL